MVKIGNMLAMGGTVGNRCYLSKEMIDEARSEQCHEICPLLGDIVLGLGFGLDGDLFHAPRPDSFHWGGYGGSWLLMDPGPEVCLGYVMNNCIVNDDLHDPRQLRIWDAYADLGA
jgi:CubicO group peptidase (beta-lactamase class C family)